MTTAAPPLPRTIPEWPARSVLLEFIRAWAPDLRIRKIRFEDGKRGCAARFTLGDETLEAEAVEDGDLSDPDDAIVRRVAWLIYRRLGLHTRLDEASRTRLEQAVLQARMNGDAEYADKLALELVMLNEGRSTRVPLTTRFQR